MLLKYQKDGVVSSTSAYSSSGEDSDDKHQEQEESNNFSQSGYRSFAKEFYNFKVSSTFEQQLLRGIQTREVLRNNDLNIAMRFVNGMNTGIAD